MTMRFLVLSEVVVNIIHVVDREKAASTNAVMRCFNFTRKILVNIRIQSCSLQLVVRSVVLVRIGLIFYYFSFAFYTFLLEIRFVL